MFYLSDKAPRERAPHIVPKKRVQLYLTRRIQRYYPSSLLPSRTSRATSLSEGGILKTTSVKEAVFLYNEKQSPRNFGLCSHIQNYLVLICKVGFTILSHAATLAWRIAIRRIPMFSIMFLGGSGRSLISLELICFDLETMERYLS